MKRWLIGLTVVAVVQAGLIVDLSIKLGKLDTAINGSSKLPRLPELPGFGLKTDVDLLESRVSRMERVFE